MAWERRADFFPDLTPLEEAIRIGLASGRRVTVVSAMPATRRTGGSAADSAAVLKALLAAGADRASRPVYLTLCDPEAVRVATAAGVGAGARLALGRAFDARRRPGRGAVVQSLSGRPLPHGRWRAERLELWMGPTALAIGAIRVLVRTLPRSSNT